MLKKINASALVDRLQSLRPSKQTMLSGLRRSLIVPIILVGVYVVFPLLRDGIPLSPQQRVEPLKQRINDLDKQIKVSPTATDLKEIATLEKGRIDSENTIRTSLFQAVGGLLVFVTLYISWLTLKANEAKQVAERFSKAVEQLGSDNIHVRLGGIFMLEQVAKDAEEKYYWQVMETLTSYVRVRSPYPTKATKTHSSFVQAAIKSTQTSEPQTSEAILPLSADIQAVMTVLARRKHTYGQRLEPHRLDLHGVDLHQLRLSPPAQLYGVDLSGANLQGAQLDGVILQAAVFEGAVLQKAFLNKANLYEANFNRANLQEARLQYADLRRSSLEAANFKHVLLDSADLRGSSSNGVKSRIQEQLSLFGAYLNGANLQSAYLPRANFQRAWLVGANLKDAFLGGAILEQAILDNADLSGADLTSVKLQNSSLWTANLQAVNLRSANLEGALLRETNLRGTKFREIDPQQSSLIGVRNAVGLTWEQLDEAALKGEGAILPDYLPPRSQQPPTETARSPHSKEILTATLNAIRVLAASYKSE
ncbi:MAG: pentapeptide repeat-containing protein [Stenomitos frigidus ULC029]